MRGGPYMYYCRACGTDSYADELEQVTDNGYMYLECPKCGADEESLEYVGFRSKGK